MQFEALLVAALGLANAGSVAKAAVDDAEIVVVERGVFERSGADFGALGPAATAHELGAESGVHPGDGGPVEGVAENEPLAGAVADIGDEKTGLAKARASGSGGVR